MLASFATSGFGLFASITLTSGSSTYAAFWIFDWIAFFKRCVWVSGVAENCVSILWVRVSTVIANQARIRKLCRSVFVGMKCLLVPGLTFFIRFCSLLEPSIIRAFVTRAVFAAALVDRNIILRIINSRVLV